MAQILVLGAGLGGLTTAMLLARDGHEVTVLERDPAGRRPAADEAWDGWERRGVNQFRLPHFMLPRWRAEMRAELPERARAALAAAGGAAAEHARGCCREPRRGPIRAGRRAVRHGDRPPAGPGGGAGGGRRPHAGRHDPARRRA